MRICLVKNFIGDTSERKWFEVCSFHCVGSLFILISCLDYTLNIRI